MSQKIKNLFQHYRDKLHAHFFQEYLEAEERSQSLKICHNALEIGYRSYVPCTSLATFQSKGLTKCDLLELKKKLLIVYPWDFGYNNLRQDVNERIVYFPLALIKCRCLKDIIRSFNLIKKYNFPFTIRSGGHSYESYSLSNGIVLDLSLLQKVTFKGNQVCVQSGLLLGPLALQLSQRGFLLSMGTCANNGVAGLTLGGGIGFLNRKLGLTLDAVREMEVVLSNNKVIKVNDQSFPDLFWALRGSGGGNYGLVMSFTYEVTPIPPLVLFDLIYPFSSFTPVFTLWQNFAPGTTNNLTTEVDLFHNRVLVTGLFIGQKEELEILLQPFIQLNPTTTLIEKTTFIDSVKHFTGTTIRPPFFKNRSSFAFNLLNDEALEIIKTFMAQAQEFDRMEFNALQGAVSQVPISGTAFYARQALFWIQFLTSWSSFTQEAARMEWINTFYDQLRPLISPYCYVNCVDGELKDYLNDYYGSNLAKLKEVKKKYDPTNFFNFPQSIPV